MGVRWMWVGNFLKSKNGYNGKLSLSNLYKVATTRKFVIENIATYVLSKGCIWLYRTRN